MDLTADEAVADLGVLVDEVGDVHEARWQCLLVLNE
jgi:hypothetical protein